jgi:hypothetical protein
MKNILTVIFFVTVVLVAICLRFFYGSDSAQDVVQENAVNLVDTNNATPGKPVNSVVEPLIHNQNTLDAQHKIGLTLSALNADGQKKWAEALSRNAYEHQSRLDDLKFALRAEVIEFPALAIESLRLSSDVNNPTMISLPSLGQEQLSVAVLSNNVQADGNGHITGTLAGDPASSVVIGFHNGETSGMIESAEKVFFYDAYDGKAVIVRELDVDKYRAAMNADSDGLEEHHGDSHE